MFNRYASTKAIVNNNPLYKNILKDKNLKLINQYETFDFKNLKNIEEAGIAYVEHTVKPFERMDQISQKYYGAPEYGWLICYTNQIGSEFDLKEDTVLKIYIPLLSVLGLL
jgi:hypothetical protein